MKGHYLPENWTVEKSQVYCARVADGTHDTPKQVPEGKILVTSKNIKNGKVNFDGCYLISENDYSQINKRSKVDKGDVLFSMIGTVGEIAFVDEEPSYAIKNIGLFKTKSFSDGKWLYYYLTSKIGQAALDTFLTGTSQQFVSLGDLRKVPVIRAPQKNQRKIAAVLSAYDDLIENNNRRIAILEKMAEELYREWFVRLRFPGHEKTKIIKGVPNGWEVVPAGKYIKLVKGRSYTSEEIEDYEATDNHNYFITLKNFKRGGGYRADDKKYYCGKYNDNQVVSGGSLVVAVTDMTQDRAVIGEVARIPNEAITKGIISCDVVKVEPVNISISFLYASLRFSSYSKTLKEFANGANVLHLKPELATKQKVIIPPKDLRDRFDDAFVPLIESMDRLNPSSWFLP